MFLKVKHCYRNSDDFNEHFRLPHSKNPSLSALTTLPITGIYFCTFPNPRALKFMTADYRWIGNFISCNNIHNTLVMAKATFIPVLHNFKSIVKSTMFLLWET